MTYCNRNKCISLAITTCRLAEVVIIVAVTINKIRLVAEVILQEVNQASNHCLCLILSAFLPSLIIIGVVILYIRLDRFNGRQAKTFSLSNSIVCRHEDSITIVVEETYQAGVDSSQTCSHTATIHGKDGIFLLLSSPLIVSQTSILKESSLQLIFVHTIFKRRAKFEELAILSVLFSQILQHCEYIVDSRLHRTVEEVSVTVTITNRSA